jgi:uncharacterized protein YoxC
MAATTTSSSNFVLEVINNEQFKDCIKSLMKESLREELKEINREVNTLKEEVSKLRDEVDELKGSNHELQCKTDKLTQADMQRHMYTSSLANQLHARSQTIEDLQQYTRRNCVLVTGVPEKTDEKTDAEIIKIANDKMKLPLTEEDLDRSHRIGRARAGKPRSIVVKFARYNVRNKFITNRRELKGSGMSVQELLTPYTQHLLKRAKDLIEQADHVKDAWTWDGKIVVLVKTNGKSRKITINDQHDLNKIYNQRSPVAQQEDTAED